MLAPDGKSLTVTYYNADGKAIEYEVTFAVNEDGSVKYSAKSKVGDEDAKPYGFTTGR